LLVSRFTVEIHAGINTGIIRSMAGSGSVVTAAGLVFAFTMASFIFSDLRVLGQIGTTITLGLLFDTLIVQSFMTPSIAALLGGWSWWPVRVRQRPARTVGADDPRQLSLFEWMALALQIGTSRRRRSHRRLSSRGARRLTSR
jgi:RND superfamily putative drug exporter